MRSKCCLPYYTPLAASWKSEATAEVRSDTQLGHVLFHQCKRVTDWLRLPICDSLIGCVWNLPIQKIEIPARLWMLSMLSLQQQTCLFKSIESLTFFAWWVWCAWLAANVGHEVVQWFGSSSFFIFLFLFLSQQLIKPRGLLVRIWRTFTA